ncbi:DUF952 domain-containing protein [Alphaproteobacteria bacterium]|nr:DUF952 domain-containing protein [Alphaproteobacteria bacterium]
MSFVYKICSKNEWNKAIIEKLYTGSEVDNRDGFIHLSTKKQLKETATKHFKGQENLLIICFRVIKIKDKLKWEISRNEELFPHYYGNLETNKAEEIYNLNLNANSVHEFPENFFS